MKKLNIAVLNNVSKYSINSVYNDFQSMRKLCNPNPNLNLVNRVMVHHLRSEKGN